MPAPDYLGYVFYLLLIFVPGIGFGELLGVWRKEARLVEGLALAFGLGLAINTIVMAVRTSGFTLFGITLLGLDLPTMYFVIGIGVIAFFSSFLLKKRFSFPVKLGAPDLVLLLVILLQGAMVWLYFQKYPIFPEYQSQDYAAHVQFAQGLLSGSIVSIPNGILYFGVHYQLASALLFVGGEGLVTARITMAILVVLSPLLFYLASSKLLGNRWAGLLAAVIYSLSASVWFDSVFDSGLYANFFGILAVLLLLVSVVGLDSNITSPSAWVFFILALGMTYFSHYTAITLLPALFIVPLIHFLQRSKGALKYLAPPVFAVAPGGIALLAFPGLLSLVYSLAVSGGGGIRGGTTLSALLSSLPVMSYMALEVFSDTAFVVLFALAAVYVYRGVISKGPLLLIPLLWFVSLVVASPRDVSAWRFSFEALVPLTIMAGYGLYIALPKRDIVNRKKGSWKYTKLGLALLLLLSPILVSSWGQTLVADSTTDTTPYSNSQQNVYSAIYWLKDNTPSDSKYLSVSDWRFTYTDLFMGRTTDYAFYSQPSSAVTAAQASGAGYIIVTNLVTESIPPDPSLFPWNNFHPSSNLTLIYSNDDVKVFKIT